MVGPSSELRVASNKNSKSRRRRWFRLIAVLMSLVPLLILEVGLWAFNIGNPSAYEDPFVGFSRVHSLFKTDETGEYYKTVLSRERFFGTQTFLASKPGGAFRAFCLGGSTVRGRPYETQSAFSKWLQLELDGREPDRIHEVVNCGGLSYASYRLVPLLEEVLNYEPDVVIVATGHNEFLEDRTYKDIKNRSAFGNWIREKAYSLRTVTVVRQLLGTEKKHKRAGDQADGKSVLAEEVDARLDQASGYASYHFNSEWKERVNEHFGVSLRAMTRICRKANVPLIFVHLGSNLRDCPPFKSEHPPSLQPEQEAQWQREFELAAKEQTQDPESALEHLRKAEEISEQHPLLAFRLARCLDRMGRTKEAANYYRLARDWDVCPLRMTTALSESLLKIAAETKTPLVEECGEIESLALDAIPGNDWYMDHVHPSIPAHQRIAQRLAEQIVKLEMVKDSSDWTPAARRKSYQYHFNQIGGERFLAGGGRRVQWLENWARRHALFDETLPDTPRGFLHKGFREFEFGQGTLSWNSMMTALEQDLELGNDVLQFAWYLFEGGRAGDARSLLLVFDEFEFDKQTEATADLAAFVLASEIGDPTALENAGPAAEDSVDQVPDESPWKQAYLQFLANQN